MKCMKWIFWILALGFMIAPAQNVINAPGPYSHWQGDTLKKGATLTSKACPTGRFPYSGVWIKTTNPADSNKYRISFKCAMGLDDVYATPSDSLGAEYGNTVMRITDTLWHVASIYSPCADYMKLYVTADGTAHGNRARIWIKQFFWNWHTPNY